MNKRVDGAGFYSIYKDFIQNGSILLSMNQGTLNHEYDR